MFAEVLGVPHIDDDDTFVSLVRPVNRMIGVVSGASLYIYLTHSDVYPLLLAHGPLPAVAVALAAGVVTWVIVQHVTVWVEARLRW